MMINMGSVQAFVQPILESSGITDALTVHWVEDCLMLGGARFVSREEVQSGEYKNTLARKIANYKAGSPNPYAEWRTVFGSFPNVVKDYCQVADYNWELPSEYRQYAEMIAVFPHTQAPYEAEWSDGCTPALREAVQSWQAWANSPGDDWAGLQPPRPVGDNIRWMLETELRWGAKAKGELLPPSIPDPRSESLAKALRFT